MTLSCCALYISWNVSDIWQIEAQRGEKEVNQMRNDSGQNEEVGCVDGDNRHADDSCSKSNAKHMIKIKWTSDIANVNDDWIDVDVVDWERVEDDPETLSVKDKSLCHVQLEWMVGSRWLQTPQWWLGSKLLN